MAVAPGRQQSRGSSMCEHALPHTLYPTVLQLNEDIQPLHTHFSVNGPIQPTDTVDTLALVMCSIVCPQLYVLLH